MKEIEIQELLTEALYFNDEENENKQITGIKTFEEAGVLTSNKGIVIRLNDGTEFQVTIVRSKCAD